MQQDTEKFREVLVLVVNDGKAYLKLKDVPATFVGDASKLEAKIQGFPPTLTIVMPLEKSEGSYAADVTRISYLSTKEMLRLP